MLRLYVYKIYMHFLLLATTVPHLIIHKILRVQHLRQPVWPRPLTMWLKKDHFTLKIQNLYQVHWVIKQRFHKILRGQHIWGEHQQNCDDLEYKSWNLFFKATTVVYNMVTIKQKGIKVLSGQLLRWRPCSSLVLIVNHMTCKNN